MSKNVVSVIIQARVGSTRFRGKVLKNILGKPVLIHIIERVRNMKTVDNITIATTTLKGDDLIVRNVKDYDKTIGVFRGKSDDVLDRYYQSAKELESGVIVRITSDNPLIDPQVSDLVVKTFLENECDYCCNNLPRTFPIGLDTEVFSFESLEKMWKGAKKQHEREHVTPYIRENSNKFSIINVENDTNLSHMRWTMDYKEDFDFINAVYRQLYNDKKKFLMDDVLNLLKKYPSLTEINKNIKPKKIFD